MLAADPLSETIGLRPDGDKADLPALVRSMISAGLAPILIKPDSKEPFCPLTDVTRKREDAAARLAAQAAGQRRWERASHACGKYHTMTDSKTAKKYLDRAAKLYVADACNLALHVGRSRMVCVDADQASEVAAFTGFWASLTGEMAGAAPTVWSPGKVDPATGIWSHSGGGHFWLSIPDGVELPSRMGTWTSPHGWVAYWGDAYVLVPPSVRPEGPYRWTGTGVQTLPAWLHAAIWGPELEYRERAARRGQAKAEGSVEWSRVDDWAARTEWSDILEPDGWEPSGRVSTCGCDEWTAPGDHGSPKSATAHGLGCGQFDDSPGHNPLHIWTDSPPDFLVDAPKTVTKLQYVAWRDHGGDVGPAMGALGIGSDGPALVPLFAGVGLERPVCGATAATWDTVHLHTCGRMPEHTDSSHRCGEDGEEFVCAEHDPSGPCGHEPAATVVPETPPAPALGTLGVMPSAALTQPNPIWNPPGNLGLAPLALVPPTAATVPQPPAVRIPATGTRLPREFWDARPMLGHVHAEAQKLLLSADAVLHSLLAHASAMIPHTVQVKTSLPPQSLSLFTVLCGVSGTGKSTAQKLGHILLGPRALDALPTPTAEGMAEALMGTVEEEYPDPDDDTRTKKRKVRRQTGHNAMFFVDEAQDLGRQFERKEASIGGTLRSVWSGAGFGSMNASEERRRLIKPDSYHVGLIVAAQPQSLGFLVGESDLGTVQRFLFAEAVNPEARRQPPGQLTIPLSWRPPGPTGGITVPGADEILPGGFQLHVADDIENECQDVRIAGALGQASEMDSQWAVQLLKVAGVLAYLDGRTYVSTADWELARCVYDTSAAVRESMREAIAERAAEEHQRDAYLAAAKAVTVRRTVETAAQADDHFARVIRDGLLRMGTPQAQSKLANFVTARHRVRTEEFVAVAARSGLIVAAGVGARGGQLWRAATDDELSALAKAPPG